MADFQVRPFSREEVPNYRSSFAEMSGVRPEAYDADLKFTDWWFFGDPTHEGLYVGAFDGDRLVGVVGFAAQFFRAGGRRVSAAILSSAFTHADYRGKGLFSRIIKYLVAAAGQRGHEAVFGWPNETALRIYVGRLGFSTLLQPKRYVRPVVWRAVATRFGGSGARAVEYFGAAFDRLLPLRLGSYQYAVGPVTEQEWTVFMERAYAESPCMLERSWAYLRWRLSRPGRGYLEVQVRDDKGVLSAWAAVRPSVPGERQSRLHIGDYVIAPRKRSALRALAAACAEVARRQAIQEVYGIARSPGIADSLASLGFISLRTATPIVAISPTGRDLSAYRTWDFRDADVDMF
jgi:GNAT superfamily N-acetyltransferase